MTWFTRLSILAIGVGLITWLAPVHGQSAKKNLTGAEVSMGGMKSKASQRWKMEKPEKPYLYRFTLPKFRSDKEDGKLTVVADDGKKAADDLIKEWQKEFKPPEGKKIDDKGVSTVQKVKIGSADIAFLEVNGTYLGGKSPGDEKAKFRMYAASVQTPKGRYIVKAVGPRNTMIVHKVDFKAWLGNFK